MQQQMKRSLTRRHNRSPWPAMPIQRLGKSTKLRGSNERFKPLNCLSLVTRTILSLEWHELTWNVWRGSDSPKRIRTPGVWRIGCCSSMQRNQRRSQSFRQRCSVRCAAAPSVAEQSRPVANQPRRSIKASRQPSRLVTSPLRLPTQTQQTLRRSEGSWNCVACPRLGRGSIIAKSDFLRRGSPPKPGCGRLFFHIHRRRRPGRLKTH